MKYNLISIIKIYKEILKILFYIMYANILKNEDVVYQKFQKIFNGFDIYMKRDFVTRFINDHGIGHNALAYFNDEKGVILTSPSYLNASKITLNNFFYNKNY